MHVQETHIEKLSSRRKHIHLENVVNSANTKYQSGTALEESAAKLLAPQCIAKDSNKTHNSGLPRWISVACQQFATEKIHRGSYMLAHVLPNEELNSLIAIFPICLPFF